LLGDRRHAATIRTDAAERCLFRAIAARCGFRSSTTFAIEYRKRFGVAPSRAKRAAGSA